MSIDYSTYIGPYVECNYHLIPSVKKYKSCPTKNCKVYGTQIYSDKSFCDQCGSKIDLVEFSIEKPSVDADEFRMLIDEKLYNCIGDDLHFWQKNNKKHIWLPNRALNCPEFPLYKIEHEDSSIQELSIDAPIKQLEAFKVQFKNEIEIMESLYGKENVAFKWGFIHQVH